MSDTGLSPETRTTLDGVSVATPATALFRLGLRHQVIQDVCPAHLASEDTQGAAEMTSYEIIVQEQVQAAGASTVGLYPCT